MSKGEGMRMCVCDRGGREKERVCKSERREERERQTKHEKEKEGECVR